MSQIIQIPPWPQQEGAQIELADKLEIEWMEAKSHNQTPEERVINGLSHKPGAVAPAMLHANSGAFGEMEPRASNYGAILTDRANQLPLPFAEAMRLVHYSEHTTEDRLRIAYVDGKQLTKEQVIKILLEEIEFNFEKHTLPQLAS